MSMTYSNSSPDFVRHRVRDFFDYRAWKKVNAKAGRKGYYCWNHTSPKLGASLRIVSPVLQELNADVFYASQAGEGHLNGNELGRFMEADAFQEVSERTESWVFARSFQIFRTRIRHSRRIRDAILSEVGAYA